MGDGRKIVAQFHKSPRGILELRSVTVIEAKPEYEDARGYDVDLSKRYGYIFNMSSSGCAWPVIVDGIYYASRSVEIKEQRSRLINRASRQRNKTRRLRHMPRKFTCDGGDVLDWLERHGIEDHAVWCSECHDWVPGGELCEHCWWCDEASWYSTPSEPCACRGNCESINHDP